MATVPTPSLVGVVADTGRGPAVLFLGCNLPKDFSEEEIKVHLAVGLAKTHTATVIELTFTIEAETKNAVLRHHIDVSDTNQMELFDIMSKTGAFYFAAIEGDPEDNQTFRTSAKKLPLTDTFQEDLRSLLRAARKHNRKLGSRKNFQAAVRDLVGN